MAVGDRGDWRYPDLFWSKNMSGSDSPLREREDTLRALSDGPVFDILVIGGGATGCGIALDAAARGLRVALVEQGDLAEGTSSRSTKLLHGGVRYLETAVRHLDRSQYRLVREGLKERGVVLRTAPHIAHPIPLVVPLYRWWEVPYVYAGLKLYDLLAGSLNIGHSSLISRSEALRRFPILRESGLKAGVSYFDGQFNDARMAVCLAVTARKYGAFVANHVAVRALAKNRGRIDGAEVADLITGRNFGIPARVVINATGPFTDDVRTMDDPGAAPLLKVSSGIHLVLEARYSPPDTGLLIPRTDDGRVLFVLPWQGKTLVGTTDEPADVSRHPVPGEEEIDYLIHHIGRYFDLGFSRKDILSAWSGLRPLILEPGKEGTAALSRGHTIEESSSGLITVAGGKWTAYREMASETVNYAVQRHNLPEKRGCMTDRIVLDGGEGFHRGGGDALEEEFRLEPSVARHLNGTYGSRARQVLETGTSGRGLLVDGYPFIEAEVLWAVRREMACRSMDVLARRTSLAFLDKGAAKAASGTVIRIMAAELGWDAGRCLEEKELVRTRLETAL